MSSGGSDVNSATGATGNPPTTAKIESPIAKGPNAPEAPGGKGGFPAAQNPYGQQQSQVYMPPSQPTFYDQALGSPYSQSQYSQPAFQYAQPAPQYYQPQPQYYQPAPQYYQPAPQINSYGLAGLSGGMYNAYARPRPYSPPSPFNGSRMSPIEAQPPMDEMRMGVMGGGEEYWRNKRGYGQFGGPGPVGQVMPGQMAQATTLGPESLMGGLGGLTSGLGALGGSDANRAAKKGAIASHVIDPEAGRRHAEEIARQNAIARQKMMEEIRASQLNKFTNDAIQG
jgi:hypothetical protein